jgi:hypothetical protein
MLVLPSPGGGAVIESVADHARGLTIYSCSGQLSAADIQSAIQSFYDGETTPDSLFDLGDADISALSAADVAQLADFTTARRSGRPPGRTAIVASRLASFGIGRMFQAYADAPDRPVELRVFRTRDDAERWLASPRA